ncbi:MAG: manganese efflux pump [Clostridia bacterium]|nr:manganese efflux pump [Clostridia bacterium]
MDILSAFAAAVSLAADAMAVSVCCGLKSSTNYKKTALITAFMFAAFQMLMPVLGWSIGRVGSGALGGGQRIAAFLILLLLGVKMLFDARKDQTTGISVITIKELFLFSVATSIDALALGAVLPVAIGADTPARLAASVIMIGAVTFILSYGGFHFGRSFRRFRPSHAEIIGGIILIILGIKVIIV